MGNLIQDLKDAAAARAALSKDLWAAARGIDGDSAPTLIAEVERACAPYDRLRKRRGMASLGLAGSPDASMADLLPASVLADARQTLREAVGRLIAYEEERADPARGGEFSASGLTKRESDSVLFSPKSLTLNESCGRAALCLWMDSPCRCADSANHVTSSLRDVGNPILDCNWRRCVMPAHISLRRA